MRFLITLAFASLSLGAHSQFKEVSSTQIIINKNTKLQSLHLNSGELILQNTRLDIVGDVTGIGEIKGDRNSIIYIGGKLAMTVDVNVQRSPYRINSTPTDKGITYPAEVTWAWFNSTRTLLKLSSKYKIINLKVSQGQDTLIEKEYYHTNDLLDFSTFLRGIDYSVNLITANGKIYTFNIKR